MALISWRPLLPSGNLDLLIFVHESSLQLLKKTLGLFLFLYVAQTSYKQLVSPFVIIAELMYFLEKIRFHHTSHSMSSYSLLPTLKQILIIYCCSMQFLNKLRDFSTIIYLFYFKIDIYT